MRVIISEDRLNLLKESAEEVTFYEFFTDVKKFIEGLLDDPFGSDVSDMLRSQGISRNVLINMLLGRGIIKKKENIDEPLDSDGKMKSMHYLQYRVPRKNFEENIHKLYDRVISVNKK